MLHFMDFITDCWLFHSRNSLIAKRFYSRWLPLTYALSLFSVKCTQRSQLDRASIWLFWLIAKKVSQKASMLEIIVSNFILIEMNLDKLNSQFF